MTFGEKVKAERTRLGLKQDELAAKIGVTRRVICSYENDNSRPRGTAKYRVLADALNVNVNYLLTEDDAFVAEAEKKYGYRGRKQAMALVEEMGGLFAGGELSEDDIDGVMKAMQELYWKAKEDNKKYTPKKYRE